VHEPDFANNTPFEAQPLPFRDARGFDCRLVVIKASYALGPKLEYQLLEKQRKLRLAPEHWGPPEIPDYKFPADMFEFKPGTDFIVKGHAIAPHGRAVTHIDVGVTLADRTRVLRAYGSRHFVLRVQNLEISSAAPVERVPMCWSLAYGGYDASDPDHPVECKENPVGRGVACKPSNLHGKLAPRIEDPREPVREPNQNLKPAGFSPLAPHFEPRRTLAGTYDDKWLKDVYPARPADYDARSEHVAPREWVFEKPLRGGERGATQNLSPDGRRFFVIPVERPWVEWVIDGKKDERQPHLDTVILDADENVLELAWRVSIRTPLKLRKRFTQIQVHRKEVLTA
jgi:hypothetical protein